MKLRALAVASFLVLFAAGCSDAGNAEIAAPDAGPVGTEATEALGFTDETASSAPDALTSGTHSSWRSDDEIFGTQATRDAITETVIATMNSQRTDWETSDVTIRTNSEPIVDQGDDLHLADFTAWAYTLDGGFAMLDGTVSVTEAGAELQADWVFESFESGCHPLPTLRDIQVECGEESYGS